MYVFDTDSEFLFRQNSWFNYLFGSKEPGCYGAVSFPSGKSTLFIPKLPQEYKIWCGDIHPPEEFKAMYDVDEVLYVNDLGTWLKEQFESSASSEPKLHLLSGLNTDSGAMAQPATFDGDDAFKPKVELKHEMSHEILTISIINLLTHSLALT